MKTVVYGFGCTRCRETERIVKEAVAQQGITAEVAKVTECLAIASAGIASTPWGR